MEGGFSKGQKGIDKACGINQFYRNVRPNTIYFTSGHLI